MCFIECHSSRVNEKRRKIKKSKITRNGHDQCQGGHVTGTSLLRHEDGEVLPGVLAGA